MVFYYIICTTSISVELENKYFTDPESEYVKLSILMESAPTFENRENAYINYAKLILDLKRMNEKVY